MVTGGKRNWTTWKKRERRRGEMQLDERMKQTIDLHQKTHSFYGLKEMKTQTYCSHHLHLILRVPAQIPGLLMRVAMNSDSLWREKWILKRIQTLTLLKYACPYQLYLYRQGHDVKWEVGKNWPRHRRHPLLLKVVIILQVLVYVKTEWKVHHWQLVGVKESNVAARMNEHADYD